MMRYAQIDASNVCIAVSHLSGEVYAPHMIPIGPDENPIRHVWTDGEWVVPEAESGPEPVPHEVSRRQLLTGLALVDWITQQEAIDAISTGAMPAGVASLVAAIADETERFAARMKWAGFQTAYRNDTLVLALAHAEGKTPAEVDDFFRLCAAIE